MLRRMMRTLTPTGRAVAVVAVLVALIGVGISIVLLREHLTVFEGDVAGGLFCSGSGRFDCNRVAASTAAWWAGLPVALWGLAFYVTMAVLAIDVLTLPPGERAAAAAAGTVLALTAVVLDGWLAWQMFARIGAVCLNCLATYALNLGLVAAFGWLDQSYGGQADWKAWATGWWPLFRPRAAPASPESAASTVAGAAAPERPGRAGKLAVALVGLAGIVVAVVLTARAIAETNSDAMDEAVEFLSRARTETPIDMTRFEGRPSVGPANARVTIAVASDFECSYCRALAARLDQIRAEHPGAIRLIFVNAPISSKCNPTVKGDFHPHACWLAKAAICAAEHGKFWQYHDLVYREMPLPEVNENNVRLRLRSLGLPADSVERCIASADADSALARDVRLWHELRMESVPSLVINGHLKTGGIYPTTLRAIVNALLSSPS